jgi:hypothetical protein
MHAWRAALLLPLPPLLRQRRLSPLLLLPLPATLRESSRKPLQ